MKSKSSLVSLLLLLVFAFLVEGCSGIELGSNKPLATFSPSPLLSTPTVNLDHAWETCKSGGELSYEEVLALRPEFATEMNFDGMLRKCKLKETIGWIAGWSYDYDEEYKIIPNKNRVSAYVYNPFAGFGKDVLGPPEMYLVYFTDEELTQFRVGPRINFSGDLLLVDNTVAVENPRYFLLADDPAVPRPTDDEVKDLEIRLDRTMCFGSCPDYSLTITSDGKVTFEGRHYTKVIGTKTTTIDKVKMAELAIEVQKADFFGLLDEYDEYSAMVTDNPTYTLSIQMGGKSKTVTNYATGPRRLYLLQDRIDQIVNSDQWVR
jgi:hypothetical protein